MYDIVYITNLPSFYKINLLNRIAEQRKILVVFTHETSSDRNEDFYKGERKFQFQSIANKSKVAKGLFIFRLLTTTSYRRLFLCGWDQWVFWMSAFLSPGKKNAVVIESSIFESKTNGLKGFSKKIFLSQIAEAYVSGKSNADLIAALNFNGKLVKTKGVGIFHLQTQPVYMAKLIVRNFIYVGRLSPEKNLKYLIEVFNTLPDLNLTIVGFGPLERELKQIAHSNICFTGAIDNKNLASVYQKNDVFILPSTSEPWGLVVEEALNNGLPVIVSNRVGCAEELVNESVGLIFPLEKPDGLKNSILRMTDVTYYNSLRRNISNMDFSKIAEEQVRCYL